MQRHELNRQSARIALGLSSLALATVLSGWLQRPQRDEGTAAHIFQLTIAALLPTFILFLATAEWHPPLNALRRLGIPLLILAIAFGALYYLEHHRWVEVPLQHPFR